MKNNVTIKRVKKSGGLWCKTTKLGLGKKGKMTFKQEWSKERPELSTVEEVAL